MTATAQRALIDFVTPRLATGGACTGPHDVDAVVAAGVTHVVDCRAERNDADLFHRHAPSVVYLHNPTHDDGSAKPGAWFDRTISFVRDALADDTSRVLIHCAAGINRGPSALYAVLRELEGLDATSAAEAIRAARPIAGLAYAADYDHWADERADPTVFVLDGREWTLPGRLTSAVIAGRDRGRRGDAAGYTQALEALFGDQAVDVARAGLTVDDLDAIIDAYAEHPCDLCDADALTHRYAETEEAWVADCRTCRTPMVVWKHHGTDPPDDDHVAMLAALDDVAATLWPDGRWLIDQHRRSIPGHFHAHARPRPAVDSRGWTSLRPRLRAVAAAGARPDPNHGWRAWEVHGDLLISAERHAPWPARRQRAYCTAARPCAHVPNPECLCGLAFFATLDDAVTCHGADSPMGRLAWAAIATHGSALRDHALLGATWRAEEAELVALVVGPTLAGSAAELEDRYGVDVITADSDDGDAIAAAAAAAGLPALRRASTDRSPARAPVTVSTGPTWPTPAELLEEGPEQIAGGAWTTPSVDGTLISYVPTRDAELDFPFGGDERTAGARFTWFSPGEHRLALTGDEVDRILDARGRLTRSVYGTSLTVLDPGGRDEWIFRRLSDVIAAANAAWWHLDYGHLRNTGIRNYGPGAELPWHTDATPPDQTYRLSVVAMLSDTDDYEGGRLEFLHDAAPTRPPDARGTIIVFPSTLLHHVTPLTSGHRRTLVTFAHAGVPA